MMGELRTPYLCVKEFHLPYSSTPEEAARARKEFDWAGIRVMSGGVIALAKNDEADMRRYFEYAGRAGMPMIIRAPTRDNLKLLEKMVREYGIRAAIHNHGPEDKIFPTPESVLEAIAGLDARIGLCIDIGHTTRAGGDFLAAISRAGARLMDIHVKDLKVKTDAASQCDVGEGILPIVPMFRLLRKTGYSGCVNLEYEIHADAPLTGMLKSFAFMRGALAASKAESWS